MKIKSFLNKYYVALSFVICFCATYYFLSPDINIKERWEYHNEAIKLIKLAEQGDVDAQFDLSFAYSYGRGVDPNDKESLFWMLKVAEQGDPQAQFLTGLMYAHFEHNYKEAVKWYTVADLNDYDFRSSGTNRELNIVKMTKGHLSAEEITKAQKLAGEWMEKHKNE